MNNYEFCAQWAAGKGRVLDFGCGAGQVVGLLRKLGVDAHGCDTFFEGCDFSADVPAELTAYVQRMTTNNIPFPSASFDTVVNNQVMEHVPDIDHALKEIARVLKPGGRVLSMFPHREIWFEGHLKAPFVHRLKRFRAPCLYAMTLIGFGLEKGLPWCRHVSGELDKWVIYRSKAEIHAAYARHFSQLEHIEPEWLAARIGRRLPHWLATFIARKAGGLVFTCEHQPTSKLS
jgi:SAM-dependent methyltransferase